MNHQEEFFNHLTVHQPSFSSEPSVRHQPSSNQYHGPSTLLAVRNHFHWQIYDHSAIHHPLIIIQPSFLTIIQTSFLTIIQPPLNHQISPSNPHLPSTITKKTLEFHGENSPSNWAQLTGSAPSDPSDPPPRCQRLRRGLLLLPLAHGSGGRRALPPGAAGTAA